MVNDFKFNLKIFLGLFYNNSWSITNKILIIMMGLLVLLFWMRVFGHLIKNCTQTFLESECSICMLLKVLYILGAPFKKVLWIFNDGKEKKKSIYFVNYKRLKERILHAFPFGMVYSS